MDLVFLCGRVSFGIFCELLEFSSVSCFSVVPMLFLPPRNRVVLFSSKLFLPSSVVNVGFFAECKESAFPPCSFVWSALLPQQTCSSQATTMMYRCECSGRVLGTCRHTVESEGYFRWFVEIGCKSYAIRTSVCIW